MTDLHTENARLRAARWQPIETAPKGELIDIWLKEGKRWCDCYYDHICDEWRTSRPSGKLVWVKAAQVSHWMPRPSAPTALAAPAPDAPDLTDPVVVHYNMLRGTIAKPSVAQIIHLYGSAVFLELLHKLGLCRPTAHDAQSGVYWCAACRNTNAIHCAHPDECGNMRRITRDEIAAQADGWKSWLDDLPLPEFQAAIDDLQDYLTIVINALFTLNIEDEQPKPPAPDAVQEAARVPEIAALIEAAKALVCHDDWGTVNYTDNGMWFDAETLRAALRAIAGDRT